MTREDRATEAEEYRRAITIEGYEYESRSVRILSEENALKEIDALMNGLAREGWRLHTFQVSHAAPAVYIVFERRRDYKREG